jgi:hypothetical protein
MSPDLTLSDRMTADICRSRAARNRIFGELPTVDELLDPGLPKRGYEFLAFQVEGGDRAIPDDSGHVTRLPLQMVKLSTLRTMTRQTFGDQIFLECLHM